MFSYMGANRVGSQLAQSESALPVSQFICPQAYSLGTAVGGECCYRLCLSGRKFGDSHGSMCSGLTLFWTQWLQVRQAAIPGSACQCRHELRRTAQEGVIVQFPLGSPSSSQAHLFSWSSLATSLVTVCRSTCSHSLLLKLVSQQEK